MDEDQSSLTHTHTATPEIDKKQNRNHRQVQKHYFVPHWFHLSSFYCIQTEVKSLERWKTCYNKKVVTLTCFQYHKIKMHLILHFKVSHDTEAVRLLGFTVHSGYGLTENKMINTHGLRLSSGLILMGCSQVAVMLLPVHVRHGDVCDRVLAYTTLKWFFFFLATRGQFISRRQSFLARSTHDCGAGYILGGYGLPRYKDKWMRVEVRCGALVCLHYLLLLWKETRLKTYECAVRPRMRPEKENCATASSQTVQRCNAVKPTPPRASQKERKNK